MGYEKDEAMKKNEDYYKQYSNSAKIAVKSAVGVRDDAIYFLFDSHRIAGRKFIRRTALDPHDIDIPRELMDLANRMPDAYDVLQGADKQLVMDVVME